MDRRRPRGHSGFTLVELLVVVAIIGVLAAIAIPAFSGYLKRARTAEASGHLARLWSGAVTYYETDHTITLGSSPKEFPGPGGAREDALECGCKPSQKCDGAWAGWNTDGVWAALSFALPDAHSYMPLFSSAGFGTAAVFTARAQGDLDCDGTVSTFSRLGTIVNGDVTGGSVPAIQNELE